MTINRELFEAWLFSQAREREFDYRDNLNCLFCKFLKENTSISRPSVSSRAFRDRDDMSSTYTNLPDWFLNVVNKGELYKTGANFGKAQDAYLSLFPTTLDHQLQSGVVPVHTTNGLETPSNQVVSSQGCDKKPNITV